MKSLIYLVIGVFSVVCFGFSIRQQSQAILGGSGDVIYIGPTALSNTVPSGTFYDIVGIGQRSIANATIQNSHNISVLGNTGLDSSVVTNSYDILALGAAALYNSKISNCLEITAISELALQNSTINQSRDISAMFDGALGSSTITNCQDITAIADSSLGHANLSNSHDITAIGNISMSFANVDSSYGIMALNGALRSSTISNTHTLVGIGETAGESISGSYTNVILIGEGATIGSTGKNLLVLGPNMNLVYGNTNTAPVSSAAPTKWISVQITGESTVYRLPLYE